MSPPAPASQPASQPPATRLTRPRWQPFFRDVGAIVDVAWDLASGADLAFPEVPGRRTARMRMTNRYVALVQAAAADDPANCSADRTRGAIADIGALLRAANHALGLGRGRKGENSSNRRRHENASCHWGHLRCERSQPQPRPHPRVPRSRGSFLAAPSNAESRPCCGCISPMWRSSSGSVSGR